MPEILGCGIGYLYGGQPQNEVEWIKNVYMQGVIRVLIVTSDLCWSISDLQAHLVIV
jgi:superfamily II DNA/RNA helicase